jgi:hypothetical protein
MCEGLQGKNEVHVDEGQKDCQRPIDQCAVDEQIDIPQPVAQDGDAKGEGNEKGDELKGGVSGYCQE